MSTVIGSKKLEHLQTATRLRVGSDLNAQNLYIANSKVQASLNDTSDMHGVTTVNGHVVRHTLGNDTHNSGDYIFPDPANPVNNPQTLGLQVTSGRRVQYPFNPPGGGQAAEVLAISDPSLNSSTPGIVGYAGIGTDGGPAIQGGGVPIGGLIANGGFSTRPTPILLSENTAVFPGKAKILMTNPSTDQGTGDTPGTPTTNEFEYDRCGDQGNAMPQINMEVAFRLPGRAVTFPGGLSSIKYIWSYNEPPAYDRAGIEDTVFGTDAGEVGFTTPEIGAGEFLINVVLVVCTDANLASATNGQVLQIQNHTPFYLWCVTEYDIAYIEQSLITATGGTTTPFTWIRETIHPEQTEAGEPRTCVPVGFAGGQSWGTYYATRVPSVSGGPIPPVDAASVPNPPGEALNVQAPNPVRGVDNPGGGGTNASDLPEPLSCSRGRLIPPGTMTEFINTGGCPVDTGLMGGGGQSTMTNLGIISIDPNTQIANRASRVGTPIVNQLTNDGFKRYCPVIPYTPYQLDL